MLVWLHLKVLLALHLRNCHTDRWHYYIWFSFLCLGEFFMTWRFGQRFNLLAIATSIDTETFLSLKSFYSIFQTLCTSNEDMKKLIHFPDFPIMVDALHNCFSVLSWFKVYWKILFQSRLSSKCILLLSKF